MSTRTVRMVTDARATRVPTKRARENIMESRGDSEGRVIRTGEVGRRGEEDEGGGEDILGVKKVGLFGCVVWLGCLVEGEGVGEGEEGVCEGEGEGWDEDGDVWCIL